eukprot:jgi/Mesvir1/5600/Mv15618-RA.1
MAYERADPLSNTDPFMSQKDLINRRGLLMYVSQLLNTHHVKGFGGVPPPSPLIHQIPRGMWPAPASQAMIASNARIPPGMPQYQLAQTVNAVEALTAAFARFPQLSDASLQLISSVALMRQGQEQVGAANDSEAGAPATQVRPARPADGV